MPKNKHFAEAWRTKPIHHAERRKSPFISQADLPLMMRGLLGAVKEMEECFEQMHLAVSPITGAGRELRQQCHGVKRDLQNFRKHYKRFEENNSTQGVTDV